MTRLIQGVGINDADYVTQIMETISYERGGRHIQRRVWACPFYLVWRAMIARGYSEKLKAAHPTYKDVIVCEEWFRFSNFKAWMATQDYEGNELDKDVLSPGNKIYNPETCVFVSCQVNNFIVDCRKTRGEYKIGVCWNKRDKKFQANCSNPFTGKLDYLGYFTTEQEAHKAWLAKKLEHAYALALLQTDERVAKALVDRYKRFDITTCINQP